MEKRKRECIHIGVSFTLRWESSGIWLEKGDGGRWKRRERKRERKREDRRKRNGMEWNENTVI